LKGNTGGYKPHVDFYSAINRETLAREFLLDDADVCVCMVAIDDMDEGNGCPFVAPGQHTRGPVFFKGAVESLSYGDKAVTAGVPLLDPGELQWVPVALAAGDVLIYGNYMPHFSKENTSERDRRALFAVYTDLRHGELRGPYYRAEAEGRRKAGSEREGGKANGFFTGQPVLQREGGAVAVA
jgi:ectoine hydroxylase-related dioxygenase (phytanoyl-CoA dioxygenase family)